MAKKKNRQPQSGRDASVSILNNPAERFRPLVPETELSAYDASLQLRIPAAIRMNPQKSNLTSASAMADRYNWQLEPVPFCSTGYRFVIEPGISPGKTSEHRAGAFYIQDSASMLPVSLFVQNKLPAAPLILDMAASPGGKTTHLVSVTKDAGFIIANDGSASRITALKKVLKNWGAVNHAVTNFPGERFGDWFANTFDVILLDAPCSMQGLVSSDSHPIRPITEREEKSLALRQFQLLESAFKALRPGGQLVYSTCTLSPLENEAVIDSLLTAYPQVAAVEDAQGALPTPAPGILSDGANSFDPAVSRTVRLWPHRYQTAGFFAALLSKSSPVPVKSEADTLLPERAWGKSGFRSLSAREIAEADNGLNALLGFDLSSQVEERGHQLAMREAELWELPGAVFPEEFRALPVKSIGMRIASRTSGGWNPDFDWISLNFQRIQHNRFPLDADAVRAWSDGQDLRISAPGAEKGTILFMMDEYGIPLGAGTVSNNRIRNLNKQG